MKDEHNKPPTTVREIGIHLGYLREDIEKMNSRIEDAIKNYATKIEVEELKSEIYETQVKVDSLMEFKTKEENSFWNNTGKTIERGVIGLLAAGVLGVIIQNASQSQQIGVAKELLKQSQATESSQQRQIDEPKEK